jgi:competence protein CoiA
LPLRACLNDEVIFAFKYDEDAWHELKATYKNQALVMPCCESKAIPKISKLNNYFFAHSKNSECLVPLESAEHIFLKTLIAKTAMSLGWDVITEKHGETPDGEPWIADVYCTKGNAKVVFEIQWSAQTLNEFKRRQALFTASGVRAAWLYKIRRNQEYYQTEIPVERETPAFAIKYRKDSKDIYVPEFDASVDDFVGGMLQGKLKWFPTPKDIITAKLILAQDTCWKCKKSIKSIVGLNFYNNLEEITSLCFTTDGIPKLILKHTTNKDLASYDVGAIKNRYSKTAGGSYLSNGCCHCDAIQGDLFIQDHFFDYYYAPDGLDPIMDFNVNFDEIEAYIDGKWYFEGKKSDLQPQAGIVKETVAIESDYSNLSDYELQEFALTTTKEDFRKHKGIPPDLPGWSGWVKSDAEGLYKHLKAMQNLPGHVLLKDTELYMQTKNNSDGLYKG